MAKKTSYEMILGLLKYQLGQWESQLSSSIQGSGLDKEVEILMQERLLKRIKMIQLLIDELQKPI